MSNKNLTPKALKALKYIRNTLVYTGKAPSVREIKDELGYNSPNSAVFIINQLINAGYIGKQDGRLILLKCLESEKDHARTIKVPIVGTAPCGQPLLAEQNIEGYISVSTNLAKPAYNHFLLHAFGDSMNDKGINDGDLVLVRQQSDADSGDTIVALIDDEATIKEYRKGDNIVSLLPKSKNKIHKPIILDHDFQIQGIIISIISN